MRKHSSKKATRKAAEPQWSVGLDLGDRTSRYAIVDREGGLIEEGECVNTPAGLTKAFADMPRARIARDQGLNGDAGQIVRELIGVAVLVETVGAELHGLADFSSVLKRAGWSSATVHPRLGDYPV